MDSDRYKSILTDVDFSGLIGEQALTDTFATLRQVTDGYLSESETAELCRAANYGAQAHDGQMRKSGGPYFTHPIEVCRILALQHFELPILQAALLHDVLEDTGVSRVEMAQNFGSAVTAMVDGVSKLQRLKDQGTRELEAGSFQKMLFATADDPRVIIIKLADRLHNMQTLGALPPKKRLRKAKETFDVYIPIAGRLGLFDFRTQLEDLVFSHLYPWRYAVLKAHYKKKVENVEVLERVQNDLQPLLKDLGINATVVRRQRHLWGIYLRMKRKNNCFAAACQTLPVRIITQDEDSCYRVLGCVHRLYRPVMHKFCDYIAEPKSDGYRSIHTSVLIDNKDALNVQIRTHDMDRLSENGIFGAWYQHRTELSESEQAHMVQAEKSMRKWLRRLKDVQDIALNPIEFYDAVKKELIQDDIYAYTPRGKVIDLPRGATPVDFAYALHTKLGDQCVAARVNGEDWPLYKPLGVGQTVEIIRNEASTPQAGWLRFVATARARIAIRHHIRHIERQEAVTLGKRLLDMALRRLDSSLDRLDATQLTAYLDKQGISDTELFTGIARDERQPLLVASALVGQGRIGDQAQVLEVHSALDSAIHFGDCCYPLPFEPILGHMKPRIGIKIHRRDCIQAQNSNIVDWVRVDWAKEPSGYFEALLAVMVEDRRGMMAMITQVISEFDSNINDVEVSKADHDPQKRVIRCWIQVRSRDHLAAIMRYLRVQVGVVHIKRL